MTPTQKAVEAAVKAMKALEDEATADPENIFGADLTSLAEAAITAYLDALAVDGLCLVPKEPTVAMLAAGERAWINDPLKRSSTLYRAMIAAASDGEERK